MWEHLKEKGIKLPNIKSEEINKKIVPVLRKMESAGIKLDVDSLNKLTKEIEKKLKGIEAAIYKDSGEEFNINSPVQLSDILFAKLKLSTDGLKKGKSGTISTAANELKKIEKSHKIVSKILQYRELTKLLSTYLKPLPLIIDKDSRIHTTYGQDTNTGRLNSSEPNLQNIPIKGEWGGKIRKAFVAEDGMELISADYSQIELRIVARLSGDTAMIDAFKSGIDIHTRTASELFGTDIKKVTSDQRRIAKMVNFGVVYGISAYGLSQALGIDQHEASLYIQKYFDVHKGIKEYCNQMIDFAHENGYVETLFGFRRTLPNIHSPIYNLRDGDDRIAINTPVQGTAAEILKLAMIELDNRLEKINKKGFTARMLLTVHDELVVETVSRDVGEIAKVVKSAMEDVVDFGIPLLCKVECGKNWGEMRKIC